MQYKYMTCGLLLIFVFMLVGCEPEKPDKAYRNQSLSTYENEVRDITPYTAIDSSARSSRAEESPPDSSCFSSWESWKPDMNGFSYTVLDKLFDPDNGIEGIYGPVQEVDGYIERINANSGLLDEVGETVTGQETFSVLSIDNRTITVPFFEDKVSVDRIVKYDSGDVYHEYLAFTIEDKKEKLVGYYRDDMGQFVTYGERDNETGNMIIKAAAHRIYTERTDSFKGAFIWRGNIDDGWFSVTQKTNAADGNWQVLGGGSIKNNDGMAFMARAYDCGNEWYYIEKITNDQILNEIKPGDPIAAASDPPDGSTPALKYITQGYSKFPGILENYPTEEILCDWCIGSE